MDKKQYKVPEIRVVAVRTVQGFFNSLAGVSHEGFLGEQYGNELFIDNTSAPAENDWVQI